MNSNNKKMDSIYNKQFTDMKRKSSPVKKGRPSSTENLRSKLYNK